VCQTDVISALCGVSLFLIILSVPVASSWGAEQGPELDHEKAFWARAEGHLARENLALRTESVNWTGTMHGK